MNKIIPNLWYNKNAEEAVNFYTSIFKNSKIKDKSYYGEASSKVAEMPKGSLLSIEFELDGNEFLAINGGPAFKFTEAVSFMIDCKNQEEVDYFWDKLTEGGEESVCGWLKDKYGLSWQVVPTILNEMLKDKDAERAERVMKAMLDMKKIIISDLEKAYGGEK